MFSDHAVLQRDMKVPVWGWAEPGEKVKVTIPNQKHTAEADADGRWQVTLEPLAAGGSFTMVVEGKNRLEIKDIQVGDVWLCSGQSNMEWSVADARDGDLEIPAANFPNMRLITVATTGSQTPVKDFDGHWERLHVEDDSAVLGGGVFLRPRHASEREGADRPDRQFVGRIGVRGLDSPRLDGRQSALRPDARRVGQDSGRIR